ncbi:hypothetical protein [uncultured Gimesia sp.]|uniref:hypothetical protein n=1 Tax=uncultured Gimesia sp. TaxID=1678688 RepID=UPI0026178E58|nr:hypothetical protein [uncultured Gimesia sp.]
MICFFYSFELKGKTNSSQIEIKQFPIQKKWGTISALPLGLKLEIKQLGPKEKVLIPRMNNRVKTLYLAHDPQKKPLTLKSGIEEWEIQLPPKTPSIPTSVIVEFKEHPYLPLKPKVIREDQNQQLILEAKDAIVHGKLLRYEPQPHKNTVGYWANENDWCEWKLNAKTSGVFDVYLLQGCGKGQGGSKVNLSVNDQILKFIVEDTSHFQNFKERHLGMLTINKAGVQSLKLKPQQKAQKAVMDVRQILLVRQ